MSGEIINCGQFNEDFAKQLTDRLRYGWDNNLIFKEKKIEDGTCREINQELEPGWSSVLVHLSNQIGQEVEFFGSLASYGEVEKLLNEAEAFLKIMDDVEAFSEF